MSKKTTVNGLKYFFLFYEFMVIGWLKVSLASLCCCCYFGYDAFVKTNLSSFEKLRWYKMIFAQLKYKYRTAGLFRQLKISCYSREAEFIRLQQDKLGSCLPPHKSNVSLSRGDSQSSESALVCSFTFLVAFVFNPACLLKITFMPHSFVFAAVFKVLTALLHWITLKA